MGNKQIQIAIGCDAAGFKLKERLCGVLGAQKHLILHDTGCGPGEEGIYTTAAEKVCTMINERQADYGLLICGTGQGMAMAANKFPGIRAALVYDIFPAVLSKEHNNANVLCTGAWMIEAENAQRMVDAWLKAGYNGLYDEGMAAMRKFERQRSVS